MNKAACASWAVKKDENPLTHRRIKIHGPTYKMYSTYCNLSKKTCDDFHNTPTVNPVTKRRIIPTARRGLFQILEGVCQMSPDPTSMPTDEKRQNLIKALHKYIKPFTNRMDQHKYRVHMYQILEKYISEMDNCIHIDANNKLYLNDRTGSPIISFDKRIGSKSVYGMAYANVGKGFGRLLKFSTKLMPVNQSNHKEVKILSSLRQIVIRDKFPHFPIMYECVRCLDRCKGVHCPEVTKRGAYFVVLNELANMDVQQWLKDSHTEADYESVIMQYIIALKYFHKEGYFHADTHLGNALIHKVTPGGYWAYKLGNHNIYVPNTGYFLVLWDFGKSKTLRYQTATRNVIDDIHRPLYLISHMDAYKDYNGLVRPPAYLVSDVLHPACDFLATNFSRRTDAGAVEFILNLPWKHIKTTIPSSAQVINKRAYKLD